VARRPRNETAPRLNWRFASARRLRLTLSTCGATTSKRNRAAAQLALLRQRDSFVRPCQRAAELSLYDSGPDATMHRCTCAPMHRCTDAPMHRCTDAPMHRCTDESMHQDTDAPMQMHLHSLSPSLWVCVCVCVCVCVYYVFPFRASCVEFWSSLFESFWHVEKALRPSGFADLCSKRASSKSICTAAGKTSVVSYFF
jgi:hypothetical protein